MTTAAGPASALASLRDCFADVASTLVDRACVSCGGVLETLRGPACADCRARLAREAEAGVPDRPDEPVLLTGRLHVACAHAGVARELVHALKYGRRREVARALAACLPICERLGAVLAGVDVVVPVPVDPARRRQRGFNQAAVLAEELVRRLGSDRPRLVLALRRRRGELPQQALPASLRRRAVAGLMRCAPHRRRAVRGRSVAVVDDVVTTGATAREAERALLRAGAARVELVAVTRSSGGVAGEGP